MLKPFLLKFAHKNAPTFSAEDVAFAMTNGVLVFNSAKEIRMVNSAMRKITGIENSLAPLHEFLALFPSHMTQAVDDVLSLAKATHLSEVALGQRHVEVFINPLPNGNGGVIIVYDTTERKLFEEALRHEMDKAQSYLNVAGVIILIIDIHQGILLINSKGREVLGFSMADIISQNWFDTFVAGQVREDVRAAFTDAITGYGRLREYMEYTIVTKKNGERLIAWYNTLLKDDKGNIAGVLSSGEDITERKIAEEKLKARTKELEELNTVLAQTKTHIEQENVKNKAILESIGDGVIVIDKDGKTLFINRQTEVLLGWKADEVIGRQWLTIMPHAVDEEGNEIPVDKRAIYQAQKGTEKITMSYYLPRRDGTKIPAQITAAPVILGDTLLGSIVVFRDITKEKAIDRMKTEFLSLASHQLRTPLSAMKWFSEMLLDGDAGELNPEQREFVQNIKDSNERMIELVNALLDITRIESGRLIIEPVLTDLGKLIDEVLTELRPKIAERELHLIVSVHQNLPDLFIDAKLIRHVYMNLFTNAIKYTPKGGEVSVFVSKKDDVVISQVSDTGFGIPQKDHDRVFQKFFRAGNVSSLVPEGTGLGLYLIKAIVASSGGKIWFKSEENKGTTFWFSLPLAGSKPRKGDVYLTA